jgi:hypothetical protein
MLVLALAAMAAAQSAAPSPPPATPAPAAPQPSCTSPEHHQFDFWVGKWDVFGPKGGLAGHSLIEKLYNGCGIRENWMPLNDRTGGSLNIYLPEEKHWEQFWIDSDGTRGLFVGGWNGKAMMIQGKWAGPLVRISYSKNADGSVRQFGEESKDDGKTWKASFDLTYRPAKADQ